MYLEPEAMLDLVLGTVLDIFLDVRSWLTLQYKFEMTLILVDSFHEICINVMLTKVPVPLPAILCVLSCRCVLSSYNF